MIHQRWICKQMLTRPLKQDYPRDETKFIALEMLCHDDGWRRKKKRGRRQGNLSESMRLKRAMCYLIDFDCFLYFTVYVIWISNIRDNAASISETSLPQDFDNSFRNFLCAAVNCVLVDGISNVNVSFRVGNFIRNVDECWLRTDNKVTTSTSLMLIVENSSYLLTHLWSVPPWAEFLIADGLLVVTKNKSNFFANINKASIKTWSLRRAPRVSFFSEKSSFGNG